MLTFFCYAPSLFLASSETTKPQSVNVALETVLEFNRKSIPADIKFLNNIQHFINKVKTVISTDRPSRRLNSDSSKGIKFTDFVRSAIVILKSYNDDDLENVFAVFDGEIRKYHYKGCKFYELVEDQNMRRFVAQTLDDVKEKNAVKLKKILNKLMQAIDDSKFNRRQTEFFDYVDSLYRQESSDKLKSCLEDLETYKSKSKRANLKLTEVVRRGIRTIIFDHYSELNPNARRDLKIKLETIWRDMMHPEVSGHKVLTIRYTNMDEDSTTTVKPVTELGVNDIINEMKNKAESSSEISEEVTKTTPLQKYKSTTNEISHTQKTISEETSTAVKIKSVLSKKHKRKHKKISTFITLYPKNIGFNTKKEDIESTTKQTIKIMKKKLRHEKRKRKNVKRKSKKRPNRLLEPNPLIITELDSVIHVKRASDESLKLEHKKSQLKTISKPNQTMTRHRRQSLKPIKKRYSHHSTKPTKASTEHTRLLPLTTLRLYEEGMSIEGNIVERRALEKKSDNITSNSTHIMQALFNNKTQLDDVMKTNKDAPISNITNEAPKTNVIYPRTDIKLLEIWRGTTAKNNTTTSTVSTTTKKFTTSSISQHKQNITTSQIFTRPITTTIATTLINRDRRTSKVNNTKHANTSNNRKYITTTAKKATTSTTHKPEKTTKSSEKSSIDAVDIVNKSKNHTVNIVDISKNDTVDVFDKSKNDTVDIFDKSKNDTVDKKLLRSPKENEVDLDYDIDRIIKKYNITIEPAAKVESFDLNKVISTMNKRSDVKADKIKSIIENDLKNMMAPDSTGTPTPPNIMSNPFDDIDSALGLGGLK